MAIATQKTIEKKLAKATAKIGKWHPKKKEAEAELEDAKEDFYEAINTDIEQTQTLAQKTIPTPSNEDVGYHVATWYPGWRIVDYNQDTINIEEDPDYQKFVYVNERLGLVFQRNIVPRGKPQLDDELLRNQDPDLWMRITFSREESVLLELADAFMSDVLPEFVMKFKDEYQHTWDRELLPLEDLPKEDLVLLQKYIVPQPLTKRLESPRKPKDGEL